MEVKRIIFADILRGIASVSVLLAHYVGVFNSIRGAFAFPPLATYPYPHLWTIITFGIPSFNYGPFGVALFFLISGFLIPFSLFKLSQNKGWQKAFCVERFFRLWPTFVFGSLLVLIALAIPAHKNYISLPSLKAILVQLTFFRDWIGGSLQFGGVVWTLEIEVKFYLFMMLFWRLISKGKYWFIILLIIGTLLAIYFHVVFPNGQRLTWNNFLFAMPYLLFMQCGVALNLYFNRIISLRRVFLMILICYSGFAMYTDLGDMINYLLALIVFLTCFYYRNKINTNFALSFFSKISYPLYTFHAGVGYVAMRIFMGAGYPPILVLLVTVFVIMGIAYFVHYFIESPTQKLGKKIAKALLARNA
jgi:peptidoglycan/LPS O-acetylase OafA/YrhL